MYDKTGGKNSDACHLKSSIIRSQNKHTCEN